MTSVQYRRDLWQIVPVAGNAAEIGVAEGYYSEEILDWRLSKVGSGSFQFPTVYMVDRWTQVSGQKGDASMPQRWHDVNYEEAMRRVRRFGPRAMPLRGDSLEMAKQVPDRTLAFLYIDADHSYDGVLSDLDAWVPKVVPGGLVALHDVENDNYGVKEALQTFLDGQGYFELPENKPEDAGAYFFTPCLC